MLPCTSLDNCLNISMTNVILLREFLIADVFHGVFGANTLNKSATKFCTSLTLAACVSAFVVAVFHIDGLRSEKKMVWSAAKPHIAMMENEQTSRDWPERIYPCKTMCSHLDGSVTKCSVSILHRGGSPQPTAFGFIYLFPKAFMCRSGLVGVRARPAAIFSPSLNTARMGEKFSTAVLAHTSNFCGTPHETYSEVKTWNMESQDMLIVPKNKAKR